MDTELGALRTILYRDLINYLQYRQSILNNQP